MSVWWNALDSGKFFKIDATLWHDLGLFQYTEDWWHDLDSWTTLLALWWYITECVGGMTKFFVWSFATIGMSHSPSDLFLVPFSVILLSLHTFNFSLSRSMLQLSLHNFPKEINDELWSWGKIIACWAWGGNLLDIGRDPFVFYFLELSFGSVTAADVYETMFERKCWSCGLH